LLAGPPSLPRFAVYAADTSPGDLAVIDVAGPFSPVLVLLTGLPAMLF
jgi:hypothetical protein